MKVRVPGKCAHCDTDDVYWDRYAPRCTPESVYLTMVCENGHLTTITLELVPACVECGLNPVQEASPLCHKCADYRFPTYDRRDHEPA